MTPSTPTPGAFLPAKIVNVLETGAQTQVWLDKGPDDGVAVGDRVRLPCRQDTGTVSQTFGRRSVVDFATGPLPASREARVGEGGATPEPWCDSPPPQPPPQPAPQPLKEPTDSTGPYGPKLPGLVDRRPIVKPATGLGPASRGASGSRGGVADAASWVSWL